MQSRAGRLFLIAVAALVGLAAGWFFAASGNLVAKPGDYPYLVEYAPLPHHVPNHQGGTAFRFAMAHDVVHERYPRHGPAYYRERDRLSREQLAALSPEAPVALSLTDDVAAGLHRLGNSDDAIALMRDKLARQLAEGQAGALLYTSYANLGTFLVYANFTKAAAGDAAARERFREGVGLIRKAIEANPNAHFRREQWQLACSEFLLAAMDRPSLLETFDFLGNRLDLPIEQILDREANWVHTGYGRPTDAAFSQGWDDDVKEYLLSAPGQRLDDPSLWERFSPIRKHVTRVGAEQGWEGVPVPSHRTPVAFDEPALAIVGLWRFEAGADPHLALALGETMLRVGQRYVAWTAFERAALLAERFWPDAAVQRSLREHCRNRQTQIEDTLAHQGPNRSPRAAPWQQVSPPPTAEALAALRPTFEAELAHGEAYQRAYQQYEEEKIAAGESIRDERFFDEFHAQREPIASLPGPEEWFAHVPRAKLQEHAERQRWGWAVFGAGVAALTMAVGCRWSSRREPLPFEGVVDEVEHRQPADADQPPDDVVGGGAAGLGGHEAAVDQQRQHDADEDEADQPA